MDMSMASFCFGVIPPSAILGGYRLKITGFLVIFTLPTEDKEFEFNCFSCCNQGIDRLNLICADRA